jgi:hypothetical protein
MTIVYEQNTLYTCSLMLLLYRQSRLSIDVIRAVSSEDFLPDTFCAILDPDPAMDF